MSVSKATLIETTIRPIRSLCDPVLDHAGDEVGVWNQHRGPVESLDLGRAGVDPPDEALIAAHDDPVADPNAALPQQDEAGDEIVGDRLEPKADADRQRAGDNRELLRVEPDLRSGKQRGDDDPDVADDGADRIVDAGV